jgi:heme-degrading monooxygenase HmoA
MPYAMVRHKVADFAKWKASYEAHKAMRASAGIKEGHVLRNVDNPNEVVVFLEVTDLAKTRAFMTSPDLKAAMEQSGITDKPDVFLLQ